VKGEKLSSIVAQFGLISFVVLYAALAAIRVAGQSSPEVPSSQQNVQPGPSSTQSNPQSNYGSSTSVQPPPVGPSAEEIQKRIERARALAAAHQLEAAASELETARATSRDVVVREGTTIMLMGIYLEAGNYARPQSLLEETFQTRAVAKDGSIRGYFALAGQTVNGLRLHLARYRNFGVSIDNASLPPEATNDLDRARSLLERMAAQAKEIMKDAATANDGLALLEDVLGVRVSVARDGEDRERWQSEYTQAREQLGSARIEIASLGGPPARLSKNQSSASGAPANSAVGAGSQSGTQPANPSSDAQVINAGALNERASKRVIPTYPPIAKASRATGTVKVHVIVNERGEVQVQKSEGPMLLRQAAEDAARGWRFSPVVVDGKPVRLTGYIEFAFGL
jgi:TonB family protein